MICGLLDFGQHPLSRMQGPGMATNLRVFMYGFYLIPGGGPVVFLVLPE